MENALNSQQQENRKRQQCARNAITGMLSPLQICLQGGEFELFEAIGEGAAFLREAR